MPTLQRLTQIPRPAVASPARLAATSAVLYILLCSTYILVSGTLANHAAATSQQLHLIETVKGIAFIILTGACFFAISFLRYRRIQRQEKTLAVQEKTLMQAEKKLVAAMSAATVAHDLNNLLMVLSGLVDELKGQKDEAPSLRVLREEIAVGINKLSHLANRLASGFSRVVPEQVEDVDVKAALLELIAVVGKHPDGLRCRIAPSHLVPLTLELNRTLFEQAVVNLLINATQATGQNGKIEVRLTTEEGFAILEVHDNGPGVPEFLVKDIFEPCYTTKPDGTGIGLLAVTAFASSCGAEVSVGRSHLGGALFQFRIPLKHQPADTREAHLV